MGTHGDPGAVGPQGATGVIAEGDRLELLTIVEGQIEDVFNELALQMKRLAHLQMQVDDLRTKMHQPTRALPETDNTRQTEEARPRHTRR